MLKAADGKFVIQGKKIVKAIFFGFFEIRSDLFVLAPRLEQKAKSSVIDAPGLGGILFTFFNRLRSIVAEIRQLFGGGIMIKDGFVFVNKGHDVCLLKVTFERPVRVWMKGSPSHRLPASTRRPILLNPLADPGCYLPLPESVFKPCFSSSAAIWRKVNPSVFNRRALFMCQGYI